jgi:hypothetical protein
MSNYMTLIEVKVIRIWFASKRGFGSRLKSHEKKERESESER